MGWVQMKESSCFPSLWPLPHCSRVNGSDEWLRSLKINRHLPQTQVWSGMASQAPPPQTPSHSFCLLALRAGAGQGGERLLALKFCGCQRVSSELRKPQVRPNLQMQNYGNKNAGYLMRQNLGGIGFWLTCKKRQAGGR